MGDKGLGWRGRGIDNRGQKVAGQIIDQLCMWSANNRRLKHYVVRIFFFFKQDRPTRPHIYPK
uniref:Uncharacterized protein n=1 Tax=Octopus bimaculoides TaxID=37653 RepID=A0A0L8H2G3_OCTBM